MRITHKLGDTCYRTSATNVSARGPNAPSLPTRPCVRDRRRRPRWSSRRCSRCRRRSASGRPRSAPGARRRPRARRRACSRARRPRPPRRGAACRSVLSYRTRSWPVGTVSLRRRSCRHASSGQRIAVRSAPFVGFSSSSPPIDAIATPATASTTTTPTAMSHLILTAIESTSRPTGWQRSYESFGRTFVEPSVDLAEFELILSRRIGGSRLGESVSDGLSEDENDEQTTPRARARVDTPDHRGRGRRRRRGQRGGLGDGLCHESSARAIGSPRSRERRAPTASAPR